MNIQNLKDELVNISKSLQQGAVKADEVMKTSGVKGLGYGQSILDPRFKKSIARN